MFERWAAGWLVTRRSPVELPPPYDVLWRTCHWQHTNGQQPLATLPATWSSDWQARWSGGVAKKTDIGENLHSPKTPKMCSINDTIYSNIYQSRCTPLSCQIALEDCEYIGAANLWGVSKMLGVLRCTSWKISSFEMDDDWGYPGTPSWRNGNPQDGVRVTNCCWVILPGLHSRLRIQCLDMLGKLPCRGWWILMNVDESRVSKYWLFFEKSDLS